MKRVLVTSDIHGRWEKALEILAEEKYDISIDLGDSEQTESWVKENFDHYVGGNNDWDFSIEEKVIEIEGIRIAMCHGHTRGIYKQPSYDEAIAFGQDLEAQIVLHGHSHIVRHKYTNGMLVLCPGSINRSWTEHGNTYAILTLENKEIKNIEFKKIG